MGGEVVVDYGIRLKRALAADNPWLVGYAYEVPCYIPSVRILIPRPMALIVNGTFTRVLQSVARLRSRSLEH